MSQAGRLSSTGGGGGGTITTLTGNTGGGVGPSAGNINIVGTGTISVAGNPGTSTLTISSSGLSSISITGDSGGALTGNAFTFTGGTTGLTFAGAGTTETLGGTLVVANGGTGAVTLTSHSLLLGNGTSAVSALGAATNGQIPIGSTGNAPSLATITAGAGISVSNGAGSITIASNGAQAWVDVTGTSAAMAIDTGYVADNAGLVTLTLPATAAFGSMIRVTGKGTGGWLIAQNAGQTIFFGTATTTPGVGGSLASTQIRDSVSLVCVTANNDWNVISSIGNILYV